MHLCGCGNLAVLLIRISDIGTKKKVNNEIPLPLCTHLSTEPQPLIGGFYVICNYEEHLLTLQNKIRSRQKDREAKVK